LAALGFDVERAKRVLRLSFARTTLAEELRAGVSALVQVERELGATLRA
jgi:cysteine sulfinate desulfinase/cysteine desulfurase-like protein